MIGAGPLGTRAVPLAFGVDARQFRPCRLRGFDLGAIPEGAPTYVTHRVRQADGTRDRGCSAAGHSDSVGSVSL